MVSQLLWLVALCQGLFCVMGYTGVDRHTAHVLVQSVRKFVKGVFKW